MPLSQGTELVPREEERGGWDSEPLPRLLPLNQVAPHGRPPLLLWKRSCGT